MNNKQESSKSIGAGTLIAGAVMGAGAVLLADKKLRDRVSDSVMKAKDDATDKIEEKKTKTRNTIAKNLKKAGTKVEA